MGRQTDRPTVSDRGRDRDGERVKEESYLKIIECLVPTRLFAILPFMSHYQPDLYSGR